jgi:hypothetical protein
MSPAGMRSASVEGSAPEDHAMRTPHAAALLAALAMLGLSGCGRDAGQAVSPEAPQGGAAPQSSPTPQAGGTGTGSGTGTTAGQGNYGTTSPIGPTGTGGGTTDTTPSGARLQEPASAASR